MNAPLRIQKLRIKHIFIIIILVPLLILNCYQSKTTEFANIDRVIIFDRLGNEKTQAVIEKEKAREILKNVTCRLQTPLNLDPIWKGYYRAVAYTDKGKSINLNISVNDSFFKVSGRPGLVYIATGVSKKKFNECVYGITKDVFIPSRKKMLKDANP